MCFCYITRGYFNVWFHQSRRALTTTTDANNILTLLSLIMRVCLPLSFCICANTYISSKFVYNWERKHKQESIKHTSYVFTTLY